MGWRTMSREDVDPDGVGGVRGMGGVAGWDSRGDRDGAGRSERGARGDCEGVG